MATKSEPKTKLSGEYIEGIGRRKTAIARVRIYPSGEGHLINEVSPLAYFKLSKLVTSAFSPFKIADFNKSIGLSIKVKGSGLSAQAEAIRHGLSRALIKLDAELRPRLKTAGFLTRDARAVERKKPGLKKARRAPQWQKR